MLFAPTFAQRCQSQVQAAQGALERVTSRLEALAPMVLSRRDADDILDACRSFRESAARVVEPVALALDFVSSDGTAPPEALAVERETASTVRELEQLVATVEQLATQVDGRIRTGA